MRKKTPRTPRHDDTLALFEPVVVLERVVRGLLHIRAVGEPRLGFLSKATGGGGLVWSCC